MTEGDDIAREIALLSDLNQLLRKGLVEVDHETEIIGGLDADAPRFRPTRRGLEDKYLTSRNGTLA